MKRPPLVGGGWLAVSLLAVFLASLQGGHSQLTCPVVPDGSGFFSGSGFDSGSGFASGSGFDSGSGSASGSGFSGGSGGFLTSCRFQIADASSKELKLHFYEFHLFFHFSSSSSCSILL